MNKLILEIDFKINDLKAICKDVKIDENKTRF